MTTFHYILIGGVALGAVQIAVGVLIGRRLARRDQPQADPPPSGPNDEERAARLAADLGVLTASVASSVRRHNAAIESIDQRLRKEAPAIDSPDGVAQFSLAPLTNLVVGVVNEMLTANKKLQHDLNNAEAELERQANELVEHRRQSLTDPLTGLPNRRALEDHLRARMDAWRKHESPFSVLMLDIDHFKQFNDTHGHLAGDAALVAFGKAVSSSLRKHDVVARFGGEEFAVLLPYATLDEATAAVAKVRAAIARLRVEVESQELLLTASGGLAGILKHEASDSLIGRADEALYAAKRNGRDRVFLHDGEGPVPLDGGPAAGADPAAGDTDTLAGELRDACAELRAGVQDFMSEPKPLMPPSER